MAEPVTIYGALGNGGIADGPVIIDTTALEALLVRKNNDGGDILVVDTTNGVVALGGVTPVAGCSLIIPTNGVESTPAIAFGDGDTGLYERVDDELAIAINGARRWRINSSFLGGIATGQPALVATAVSGTTPDIIPNVADGNTGIGQSAADMLSLITGGVGSYYKNAAGTTQRWCTQESVADEASVVTMPVTTNGGMGFAQMGDGEENAFFSFTSAGVVTLITSTANTVNTDTDTNFCILDNGTNIAYKNRLGSTKNLFVMAWFN